MRRPGGAEFAPNAYVYPGGSVHGEDSEFADVFRAAAVRELFEEMGILLARRRGGGFAREDECRRLREALAEGAGFPAGLAGAGLEPAFDGLVPLARWITPEPLRRRFDTRFYVARLPAGQEVRPDRGEVAGWRWAAPRAALDDPDLLMVHATRRILESVAGEADVGALIRKLRRRVEPRPVRPSIVQVDGRWEIVERASPPGARSPARARPTARGRGNRRSG